MCGRYVVAKQLPELALLFDAEVPKQFETVSYNIAPTNQVAILVEREIESIPVREIHPARFGLIPHWAKEPTTLFNARIETVLEKPSFKDAALRKRCVIPASGYFEWDQEKVPHYIFGEPLISFAGIYSFWRDPARPKDDPDRWVLTCSILTKPASPALSWIHERSPVMLSEDGIEAWLAPDYETSNDVLAAIAADSDEVAGSLLHHQVSKAVGKVSENYPELISPTNF